MLVNNWRNKFVPDGDVGGSDHIISDTIYGGVRSNRSFIENLPD